MNIIGYISYENETSLIYDVTRKMLTNYSNGYSVNDISDVRSVVRICPTILVRTTNIIIMVGKCTALRKKIRKSEPIYSNY